MVKEEISYICLEEWNHKNIIVRGGKAKDDFLLLNHIDLDVEFVAVSNLKVVASTSKVQAA